MSIRVPAFIMFVIAALTTTLAGSNAVQHYMNPPKVIGQEKFAEEFKKRAPDASDPQATKKAYEAYKNTIRSGYNFKIILSLAVSLVNSMHMFAMVFYLRRDDREILDKSSLYSLVPGISPGIFLGIPIAIWIRVLLKKEK